MAPAIVTSVEALRILAIQPVHACRELAASGVEDQVVVRAHQAEGVATPLVLDDCFDEEPKERAAIVVVAIDSCSVDAPGSHVEDAVGEDAPKETGHSPKLARGAFDASPGGQIVTLS
jgi:hypothetical protein